MNKTHENIYALAILIVVLSFKGITGAENPYINTMPYKNESLICALKSVANTTTNIMFSGSPLAATAVSTVIDAYARYAHKPIWCKKNKSDFATNIGIYASINLTQRYIGLTTEKWIIPNDIPHFMEQIRTDYVTQIGVSCAILASFMGQFAHNYLSKHLTELVVFARWWTGK